MNRKVLILLISILVVFILVKLILRVSAFQGVMYGSFEVTNKVYDKIEAIITDSILVIKDKEETEAQIAVLEEQNEELKTEVANLEAQNELLKSDLEAFQTEYRTRYYEEGESVIANIQVRDISTWNERIIIDVGSEDGVKVGNPVMSNGVLIGFVSAVDTNSSEVELITNPNQMLNIPSMVLSGKEEVDGLIVEYDEQNEYLIFEALDVDTEVKSGDIIYTNGYQENVERGIPIAIIDETISENKYSAIPLVDTTNIAIVEVYINE